MFRATVFLGLISLVIGADVDADRIVGGSTALIKDARYMASMQRREVHICGGVIINEFHVLTAAHCADKVKDLPIEHITVRVGSTLWSAGGQLIPVKLIIIHPKYNRTTKEYDIAILRLKKAIEYDDVTVQPITLATKLPGDGKNALITGWGLKKEKAELIPNFLQKANVTTISRTKCSSPPYGYHEDIMKTMLCAQNPSIDSCQGDSGGPLVIGNELVGVTSFGKGCGRPEYPGVYMIVALVRNWIAKNTQYQV